jgi:hypothetical protein
MRRVIQAAHDSIAQKAGAISGHGKCVTEEGGKLESSLVKGTSCRPNPKISMGTKEDGVSRTSYKHTRFFKDLHLRQDIKRYVKPQGHHVDEDDREMEKIRKSR